MTTTDLNITDEARMALLRDMSREDNIVCAAILWWEGGHREYDNVLGEPAVEAIPPHWGIGFYDQDSLKSMQVEIQHIDEIPFVFVQGEISQRLQDATLDYIDDRYAVYERNQWSMG